MRPTIFLALPVIGIVFFSAAHAERPISVGLVFNFQDKSGAITGLISGMEWKAQNLKSRGINIDFFRENSGESALGSREAFQRMLKSGKRFDAVIAELDSSKAFAAADVAETEGQVMFTPLSTSYKVTEDRTFVFSGTFSDRRQGRALADFAASQLGAKSAAILTDASQLYSVTLSQEIVANVRNIKVEAREQKSLKMSDDVESQVGQFLTNHKDADAIFLPLYSQSAARVLQLAKRLGVTKPAFIGGDAWGQYGKAFNEIVFGSGSALQLFWASHEPNLISEDTGIKGETRFKEYRPGAEVGIAEAAGSDVLGTLVKAILDTRRAKGPAFSQRDLVSAIRSPTFFY